jgi:hypothetical protein
MKYRLPLTVNIFTPLQCNISLDQYGVNIFTPLQCNISLDQYGVNIFTPLQCNISLDQYGVNNKSHNTRKLTE